MLEKLNELLEMQEALDKQFMKYNNLKSIDGNKVKKALFDECGEVNHEMKAEWCYWKKSQKPVDREKLKEELSDVWHFALSLHRLLNGKHFDEDIFEQFRFYRNITFEWFDLLMCVSAGNQNVLYYTIYLTEKLGFTFNEMYQAYVSKNNINYMRMHSGY